MKKNTLKKLAASVLACTMLVTFAGCGGGGSDSSQSSAASASAESSGDVKTVAIVQQMDNPAFDDMREGLIEELEAKGYGEDKVKIEYQNAQGDASNWRRSPLLLLRPVWLPAATFLFSSPL